MIRIPRILIPIQKRLARRHRHHLDAILHRAGDLAKIAAHALVMDHFIDMGTVGFLQAGNRLVRSVLASDVAAAATNARLLVNPGNHLIVDVQVLPVRGVAHRAAGKFRNAGVTLTVHPARQAVLHLLDDPETVQHRRRAHLHRAAAQGDEFRGIAPVADAADPADR